MKKKFFISILAIIISAFSIYTFSACEKIETFEGVQLKRSGDEYIVCGLADENIEKLVIPSSYNDLPITTIGYMGGNDTITDVTIPDSVVKIDRDAFCACDNLTSVKFGNSVEFIGDHAFAQCPKLTNINLPDSVTTIDKCAFFSCTGLTNITIPNTLNYLGENAFFCCNKLIYNDYDSAYYLGNKNNPYLVLVKAKDFDILSCAINNKTKFICDNAFQLCTELTQIYIPQNVISIGVAAFYDCRELTTVTIPNSVEIIEKNAFGNCRLLNSINFNGTVEQWTTISKVSSWDISTPNYTIRCKDGDVVKESSN